MYTLHIIGQLPLQTFVIERGDLVIIGLAFVAQSLKEWGIPSPGVTQSSLMYAGYQLSVGNLMTGIAIIVAVFFGALCGSSALYFSGRFLGERFINRFGKYIHLTYERLNSLKLKIGNKAAVAIILGRFVPTMMAPLSFAAGTMRIPMARYSAGIALAVLLWESLFLSIGALSGKALSEVHFLDNKSILPSLLGAMLGAFLLRSAFIILLRWHGKKKANQTAGVDEAA
jgi:membrane protein DedA with SNARE-associated domain